MNQSASELILEALFHLGDDDRSSPPLSLEELLLPAALGFGWVSLFTLSFSLMDPHFY